MDVATLRWFQLVADGATVTEVSDLELTSQPTISRALTRLSDEVGTPLLHREGRLLRLTRAGAAFKRHVDAMLHHLDDGLAALAQLTDPERGTVVLAYQASLGSWLVPQLVAAFREQHPEVRLELRSLRDKTTAASDPDLELSTRQLPGRQWRVLLREPIKVVLPTDHPLTRQQDITVADLAEEPLVAMRASSQLRLATDALFTTAGLRPRISYEVDDLPSLYGYVAAGLGIALAPERPGEVVLRDLPGRVFRDIGLSWSGERQLLPAAELFRDHVLRNAQHVGSRATTHGEFPPGPGPISSTRPGDPNT